MCGDGVVDFLHGKGGESVDVAIEADVLLCRLGLDGRRVRRRHERVIAVEDGEGLRRSWCR